MGTSTGYNPPTTGNWPDFKREVTAVGQSGSVDTEHIGRILRNYVQAHAGPLGATQQMARATRAGSRLGGFLDGVRRDGLQGSLENAGLQNLVGQPAPAVIQGIVDYLTGDDSLVEEDVARQALFDYYEELLGHYVDKDFAKLERELSQIVQQDDLGNLLRQFFGHCVFRKLQRDSEERLLKAARVAGTRRLFRAIKNLIFGRLRAETFGQDLTKVQWHGSEGNRIAQGIMADVWRVVEVIGGGTG